MISITIKPFYVKDNIKYEYKCYSQYNTEYRLSLDTLRSTFGDDLGFEYEDGIFKIHVDDIGDVHTLRAINNNTNQYPLRAEIYNNGTHIQFEVLSYSFDD
jgi:hypothetical protein